MSSSASAAAAAAAAAAANIAAAAAAAAAAAPSSSLRPSTSGITQVHVKGLPDSAEDVEVAADLERILAGGGAEDPIIVGGVVVKRDAATNACRGFCFVMFLLREHADRAVDLLNADGVAVCGGRVTAALSTAKKPASKAKAKSKSKGKKGGSKGGSKGGGVGGEGGVEDTLS